MAARVGDPAPQVYARLFGEFPETQERFVRDVDGAIRGEMLAMAFQCLLDPGGPWSASLVRAERVNHDGFGTPPQVFARFLPIVMETCREILAGDWTPEIDAAWRRALSRLDAAAQ